MSAEADELFQLMLGRTTTKAVERILAAGFRKPQQVTTVEELDALPVGSTVFWAEEAWLRAKAGDSGWKDFSGQLWTLIVTEDEPATVLHVGGAE